MFTGTLISVIEQWVYKGSDAAAELHKSNMLKYEQKEISVIGILADVGAYLPKMCYNVVHNIVMRAPSSSTVFSSQRRHHSSLSRI